MKKNIGSKMVDYFIHPKLMNSAHLYVRAKITVICGGIGVVAVPFFALLYYLLHNYLDSLVVIAGGVFIYTAILLLKNVGSLTLSRELITISIFTSLSVVTYDQGGVLSPPGYWLSLVPVVATFLGGSRAGLVWAVISISMTLFIYFLQAYDFQMPVTPIKNVLLLQVICICALLIIIYVLVYFFEYWKTEGFTRFEEALKITKQKSNDLLLANKELESLSSKINAILTAAVDGIITTNIEGQITMCNPTINKIFGYETQELMGKDIGLLFQKDCMKVLTFNSLNKAKMFEITGIRKNNIDFPLEISLSKVYNQSDMLIVYVMRDITERKKSEEQLKYLAHYDQLTQLPNRLLYEILLKKSLARASDNFSHAVLLYVDLDNFKNINTSLGHGIGDIFLNEISKHFRKYLRDDDTVCRVGGDEFIIILNDVKEISIATTLAHNIIEDLKDPINVHGYNMICGCSIGIAVYPDNGVDVVTLTKNADSAMYHAKKNGRSNYQYFDEALNKHVLSQLALENQLQTALQNNEFFLVYQPQYDMSTNNIIGIEALLRWKNPILGIIKPDDFIGAAEKIGIINLIGEWVLRKACRQFKEWQSTNLLSQKTKIAINLSVMQIKQATFLQNFITILNETNINPNSVELEVTESMIMENPQTAFILLHKLVSLGIMIAIDDFGTGYSSLSRLKEFPVHTIKMDKSFLTDLVSKSNSSIIMSIISLAHGLGLTVIAEGVETLEQFTFLKNNHCDYVQGYYLKPPLDLENITDLLQHTKKAVSS